MKITEESAGFRVTFEGLKILPSLEKEAELAFGDFSLLFTASEGGSAKDLYDVTNLNKSIELSLHITASNSTTFFKMKDIDFEGLLSFAYHSYLNSNGRIGSILYQTASGRTYANLGKTEFQLISRHRSGDIYDVTIDSLSEGMESLFPELPGFLENFTFHMGLKNVDFKAQAEAYEGVKKAVDKDELTRDEADMVMAKMVLKNNPYQGDLSWRMAAGRFGLTGPNGAVASGFDSADFVFKTLGANEPLGNADLLWNLSGLKLDGSQIGIPPLYQELIPRDSSLSLHFEQVPLKQITEEFISTISRPEFLALEENPEDTEAIENTDRAFSALLGEMESLMRSSGATIRIEDTYIRSPKVELDAAGAFKVEENALFMVAGGLIAELKGLDWLLKSTQEQLGSGDSNTQEMAAGILGTLGALQAFGKPVTDEARGPRHRYDIKVTADGELMVNDIPLFGAPPQ